MYKKIENKQISFFDFNQGCGMQLDEKNEWVLLSYKINWGEIEDIYATYFPAPRGNEPKSVRIALGSLIIQKVTGLSDRKLVKAIEENPYYQFFIGESEFKNTCPFVPATLVSFRKRFDKEFLVKINEEFLKDADKTNEHKIDEEENIEEIENKGTCILDATCSPSNIKYPQDFVLLNEGRKKLDEMIDYFHKTFHFKKKPRTYREVMQKQYLKVAKSKRKQEKVVRKLIRKELFCIERNVRYLEKYMEEGYALLGKHINYFLTIQKLYEQQKYMFDNHTHRVENRIVSISEPFIRPIVRGKAKSPVEFGAKYDVSIDEKGHARLEKIQFDPYNESSVFKIAIEKYKERTGHYPKRILVDQIYRTRENRDYCREHEISISGRKLGRPSTEETNKKEEYKDNTDRIEVERFFSLSKRMYGAGLIMTKLASTTLASIALSVFVTNLFAISLGGIFLLIFSESENGENSTNFIEFEDVA